MKESEHLSNMPYITCFLGFRFKIFSNQSALESLAVRLFDVQLTFILTK